MWKQPEIAPQEQGKCTPHKKKNMVRGYPNDILLQKLADVASTTPNPTTGKPFRRGGLPIKIKKEHGWDGEMQSNTDGIWKCMVHCTLNYADVEQVKKLLTGLKK
jgi:hypothetical protein